MSDVVIVVGTTRGREDVDPRDIKQMVGRTGRKHDGTDAIAHVIVEVEREDEIREGLDHGEHMDVFSCFGKTDDFYFHFMSEIVDEVVVNTETAQMWYSRSLEFRQGGKKNFKKIFDKLLSWESITIINDVVRPTRLGCIASELYFHPENTQSWKDNFGQVFELGLEKDTAAIAWALGTRTHSKSHGDFGQDYRYIMDDFKSALPLGLDVEKGTLTQCVLWWCAMGGPPAGKLRNQLLQLKEDVGRIKRALVKIDTDIMHWDRTEFFDDVEVMVKKNVSDRLLDLCKLPGMTKSRADYLYNAGVKSAEDIEGILPNIEEEIDDSFKVVLEEIINGLRR